ncbi:MAG: DUF2270 domain-containing protein, partial [Acidobacteriota bacterium]|nr:DUF2270 domain-containing protein [Acidobacteriota bacterium]
MKRDIRSRTSTGATQSGGERNTSGAFPRPSSIHLSTEPAAPPSSPHAAVPVERRSETVTLAGRKLSPSEFNAAMIHFYRGEVQRSNTWRNRLDTTTNWAVLTA